MRRLACICALLATSSCRNPPIAAPSATPANRLHVPGPCCPASPNEWVDVRNCGATGNGHDDDSAALRKATSCHADSRVRRLLIPRGLYRINLCDQGSLLAPVAGASVVIKGDGPDASIIEDMSLFACPRPLGGGTLITFKEGSDAYLEGVAFRTLRNGRLRSQWGALLHYGGPGSRLHLKNVTFQNWMRGVDVGPSGEIATLIESSNFIETAMGYFAQPHPKTTHEIRNTRFERTGIRCHHYYAMYVNPPFRSFVIEDSWIVDSFGGGITLFTAHSALDDCPGCQVTISRNHFMSPTYWQDPDKRVTCECLEPAIVDCTHHDTDACRGIDDLVCPPRGCLCQPDGFCLHERALNCRCDCTRDGHCKNDPGTKCQFANGFEQSAAGVYGKPSVDVQTRKLDPDSTRIVGNEFQGREVIRLQTSAVVVGNRVYRRPGQGVNALRWLGDGTKQGSGFGSIVTANYLAGLVIVYRGTDAVRFEGNEFPDGAELVIEGDDVLFANNTFIRQMPGTAAPIRVLGAGAVIRDNRFAFRGPGILLGPSARPGQLLGNTFSLQLESGSGTTGVQIPGDAGWEIANNHFSLRGPGPGSAQDMRATPPTGDGARGHMIPPRIHDNTFAAPSQATGCVVTRAATPPIHVTCPGNP